MYKHLPSPVNFREDINGLRAWAVIAVLLFHFSLIGLSGGFAGVDIFFVISGYLMTAIIVGGHEKENFSIWKFYMSRLRRILPALLVVITTLIILGWFWLPTPDYQALGSQSLYGLVFISNFYYWFSSGYFDTASHEKWLLHTWSLAVETQFYLLYPLIIAVIWRVKSGLYTVTTSLFVLASISLISNFFVTTSKPDAAFYLLPTRIWELASGGLVYLILRQVFISNIFKSIFYWLGWVLIFFSFFYIDESFSWPGFWATLPVLGVSFVLIAHKENSVLTNNRLAQWLGDRSYSLYLWHWPLVVGLFFTNLQFDWTWTITAFILSLFLAHFSYKYIEMPTRRHLSNRTLKNEVVAISFFLIIIGFLSILVKTEAFDNRFSKKIEIAAAEANNVNPLRLKCHSPANGENGSPGCTFGSGSSLGAILIGDSHASASVNPLKILASQHDKTIKLWSFSGCPTIKGTSIKEKGNDCSKSTDWILKELSLYPNNVPAIIVNSSHYLKGNKEQIFFGNVTQSNFKEFKKKYIKNYVETICEISKSRRVFLVRPYPRMHVWVPQALSRSMIFEKNKSDVKSPLQEYKGSTELVWEVQNKAKQQCGVDILNPLPYLCDSHYCYGSKNLRPIYYDDNHLSEYGNTLLIPMFKKVFE